MYVGRRISKLRATHGDSLREAANRTGVSHTTIARIEKGAVSGSFHSTLRKIAEGYGVRMEFLMTGQDAKTGFERIIRRLGPEERSKLYFGSPTMRTKRILDFLITEYAHQIPFSQLAELVGFGPDSFREILDQWDTKQYSEEINLRLAESLSRMTGISVRWFCPESHGPEQRVHVPRESLSAYATLMKKAAKAGIMPQTLDIAIDLLIMREHELPPNL